MSNNNDENNALQIRQDTQLNNESLADNTNNVVAEVNNSNGNSNTDNNRSNSKQEYKFGDTIKKVGEVCIIVLMVTATIGIIPSIFNFGKTAGEKIVKTTEDTGKTINIVASHTGQVIEQISSNTADFAKKVSGDATEIAKDGIDTGKKIVKEPISLIGGKRQDVKTIISDLPPEKPIEPIIKPLEQASSSVVAKENTISVDSQQNASVSTELENTEIVVKEEKIEIVKSFFKDKNQQAIFKRNFNRNLDKVIKKGKKEVYNAFEEAKSRIPSFVESHYGEEDFSNNYVSLMNKELLTDDTLEDFIINTAKEIDDLLFDSVNEALDNALISIELGTNTEEEFRKRLPTAREICNQIYIDLMKKIDPLTKEPKYTARVNDLNNIYDSWKVKHPTIDTIGKVGFVAILAYFFPPSLAITAPALLLDMSHTLKVNKRINDFKLDLRSQFDKQCRIYEKNFDKAAREIANCYVDLIIKAKIKEIKSDNIENNKYSIEFPMQNIEFQNR